MGVPDTQSFVRLEAFIADRLAELQGIPAERRGPLDQLADHIGRRLAAGQPARLLFICTHSSRRSQIAQVWAAVAAHHHRLVGIETFSGGTEVTAFDRRAVAALKRCGLEIDIDIGIDGRAPAAGRGSALDPGANPVSTVRWAVDAEPLRCFSKRLDDPVNPGEHHCAVMTCSSADRACPVVPGALERIPLPYADPKAADDTPGEQGAYDACCRQIAREMLYVTSRIDCIGRIDCIDQQ